MSLLIILVAMITQINISGPEEGLLKNKDQYYWYFEGAGNATIEEVGKESDGAIYTQYLYYSGNERRTGKNVLTQTQEKNIYTGTWLTLGDNGNRYEGELKLTFNEDGTANGHWTWKGNPGRWNIELKKK
jgi:hypothetical protein